MSLMDIFQWLGVPTTTVGTVWMLVRIGIWYWYNHTAGGQRAMGTNRAWKDYSFTSMMTIPTIVFVVGVSLVMLFG